MTYTTTALTAACVITAGSVLQTANADDAQPGDSGGGADAQSSAPDAIGSAQLRPFELNFGAFQDDFAEPSSAADDWRVDFNSWIWLLGADGDIGVGDRTVDVSANFSDVLDSSDSIFAFSGRLEIGKGRWAGFVDGIYANIGVDDVSGPLGFTDVDVTFELGLVDLGVMYRLGQWTPDGEAARNALDITLDLYGGARYTTLELELDPARLPARSADTDWIDPFVGARLVLPIAERWHIRANGDVGGFGVESDFTWSATAVLGYDFQLFDHPASVFFGYRAIGQDITFGDASREVKWDVVLHGPILGFSLLF